MTDLLKAGLAHNPSLSASICDRYPLDPCEYLAITRMATRLRFRGGRFSYI